MIYDEFRKIIEDELGLNILEYHTGYTITTSDDIAQLANISKKFTGVFNVSRDELEVFVNEDVRYFTRVIEAFAKTEINEREKPKGDDNMRENDITEEDKIEEEASELDEMEADYGLELEDESDELEEEPYDYSNDSWIIERVEEMYEEEIEAQGAQFHRAYEDLGLMSSITETYKQMHRVIDNVDDKEYLEFALLRLAAYALMTFKEVREENELRG